MSERLGKHSKSPSSSGQFKDFYFSFYGITYKYSTFYLTALVDNLITYRVFTCNLLQVRSIYVYKILTQIVLFWTNEIQQSPITQPRLTYWFAFVYGHAMIDCVWNCMFFNLDYFKCSFLCGWKIAMLKICIRFA